MLAQPWAVNDAVRVIALPDGLRSIGCGLFAGSGVQAVRVSASVVELGAGAFRDCKGLRSVIFAEGSQLKTIRKHCFQCSGLEGIVIPSGVTELQKYAFCDCGKLRRVDF